MDACTGGPSLHIRGFGLEHRALVGRVGLSIMWSMNEGRETQCFSLDVDVLPVGAVVFLTWSGLVWPGLEVFNLWALEQ